MRSRVARAAAAHSFPMRITRHDLYAKPVSTFADHAVLRSMIFSQNRFPLLRIML
jgi:hypothetical protein